VGLCQLFAALGPHNSDRPTGKSAPHALGPTRTRPHTLCRESFLGTCHRTEKGFSVQRGKGFTVQRLAGAPGHSVLCTMEIAGSHDTIVVSAYGLCYRIDSQVTVTP